MEKIQKAIFYLSKIVIRGVAMNDATIPIIIIKATTFTDVFFFIENNNK